MNVYAVITARAGSQRVPGKNRELLPHTLDFLGIAPSITHVILTTDDDEVASMFDVWWLTKPWSRFRGHLVRRPDNLSLGRGRRMHRAAIRHAIDEISDEPGIGILLQPTSPFRKVEDFVKVVDALANTPAAWIGSIQTVYDKTHEENGNLYGFRWPPIVEEPGDWLRAETRCYLPQGQRESFQVDTPEDMEMFRKLTA